MNDPIDAQVLERAVTILRNRSQKPNGFWMNVLCSILTDTAAKIRSETPNFSGADLAAIKQSHLN